MKIAMVFDGLQIGGIERVGIEYIKLLRRRNYSITVVNLRPDLNEMEKEIPTDVKVIHIPFSKKIAPQRYSKFIRLFSCGYILFYACAIPLNIIQKIYKFIYRKEVPEADIAIAFSGHYNDLTFVSENFKNTKKIAWLHGNETSYNDIAPGYFNLYRKIKNLVCLSEKNDDCCREFNRRYKINKALIYNPINLDSRRIDEEFVKTLKQNYGDYTLMVGRMAKDKDQATLIHAISVLNKKYSLKRMLVLVGDGPEREALENLVKEMRLEEQVFFVGSRYDVENYYTAATVYAHSSPAEGLPTVLLEAMYYEVPIVSTNSEPGVHEILGDDCGIITPVGDAEALADGIYKLYTDKKLVEELSLNCHDRIKQFLPEHILMQLDDYFKKLN